MRESNLPTKKDYNGKRLRDKRAAMTEAQIEEHRERARERQRKSRAASKRRNSLVIRGPNDLAANTINYYKYKQDMGKKRVANDLDMMTHGRQHFAKERQQIAMPYQRRDLHITKGEAVGSGRVDESWFKEYKYHNSGTNMPSGEKQPPVSAKKVALRDLSSETNNFASNALDYSPVKDRGSIPDTAKLSDTKREKPSSPCTPLSHQHSTSNGHLVYVRRKLDTEPSKICLENEEQTDSLYSSSCLKDHPSETKSPGVHETKLSEVPALLLSPASLISSLVPEPPPYARKPGNLMAAPLTDQRRVSPAPQSETQSEGEGYWKERFIRLQMSLQNFDQYNQEKYIQRLGSLSAAGRSLHAVELEKRAIQLLLDEGRELQKMKLLNVLGKPLSDSQTGLSYQAFSPEPLASEK